MPRALSAPDLLVANLTRLYSVRVARIEAPLSTREVAARVSSWPGKVAIGGGRYSMGGQVAVQGGLHLDMRSMNKLVWMRDEHKLVRVQAGMRWRDLQDLIDPLNLAVTTMQSYANFTVGGSVAVNVHGRYVGHGPIAASVRALQIVLADGRTVETSRQQNAGLFSAAIGGYGAIGVITEVELALTDNVRIERVVEEVPLERYVAHYEDDVLKGGDSVLHNADLLPPEFDTPLSVTWRKTIKPLTERARLVPRGQGHALDQNIIWLMTEMPGGMKVRRSIIHPLLHATPVVKHLNHEASLDLAELEPRTRQFSTYVLQEYFIPRAQFLSFAKKLAAVVRRSDAGLVLNVSIRHSPADPVSLLPWAKSDVFSFVLYYKQRTHEAARDSVGRWTRELIELALAHGGRYYLPYQLHATQAQFDRAYPETVALRRLKAKVDPSGKFSNEMWARYL